jgi:hypothetical protein
MNTPPDQIARTTLAGLGLRFLAPRLANSGRLPIISFGKVLDTKLHPVTGYRALADHRRCAILFQNLEGNLVAHDLAFFDLSDVFVFDGSPSTYKGVSRPSKVISHVCIFPS